MKFSHATKVLFLALTSVQFCLGAVYEKFSDLPSVNYDFVVIGGGAAGNVIANRLTENPKFSVLVLEAGVSNEGILDLMVPFFNVFLPNSQYDWNYTTTPQDGLNGRVLEYPRGRVLGGCTSLNGMVYLRGSSDDYDRYANVTQDSGWSWESLQPYIRKNERWTPPADHHNTTGQFDPSAHGFHGINSVSLAGYPQSINDRVIQAATELSEEFPFNLDINSGNQIGVGWLQMTVKDGVRSSSATSYLGPEFIRRPNLHVLVQAQVTQVLQTGPSPGPGKIAFQAVEFAQSIGGPRRHVTASKEVIISAGTIGTPQILLNSGIGDEKELTPLGIETRLHLPDVGKNLSDHSTVLNLVYSVNSTDTYDDIIRNSTFRAELLHYWSQNHTGPLVDNIMDHIAFVRMPDNATIFETNPDPAAGPRTAHFEIRVENGNSGGPPAVGNFISLGISVVTPLSRGYVKLNTSNPFDHPLFDPHYLSSEFDMIALREAAKSAQRFLKAPAWEGYVLEPFGDLANVKTDAQLDQYIRANAGACGHPVGTASMSPKGAKYGVVDPDLRVKGVSGLRVVDASIFPFVPAANIQGPVYMVAERAADLIKAAWH